MSSFKAFEKRNKTLLVEYKNMFKANSFVDKRIGENDQTMSLEDKMFKRFVAERRKPREKKANKYNLNDNDNDEFDESGGGNNVELTHLGQSLSQIERFERVDLSDDDDDDNQNDPNNKDRGKISAKIVSENFFGGFDKKPNKQDDEESKKKSRKEWIDEMILKSKQIKYERQREKDKTLDLTEELDKEWRQIQPIINVMINKGKEEEEKQEKKKPDDYDVLVKTLQFDSKAKPTDKLKTEEEIEKERLDAIKNKEKELLERMNKEVELDDEDEENDSGNKKKKSIKRKASNHQSVDDMEFNDPEYLQMQLQEEIKQKNKRMNKELETVNEEQNEDDDDDEDNEDNEDNEDEDDQENGNNEDEDEDDDDDDDDDDKNEDEELEEDENEDINGSFEKEQNENAEENQFQNEKWLSSFESICSKQNKKQTDLKQFDKSIKSLIEKLDPSRDENNKKRLCLLTQHLIEYYQSLFNLKSLDSQIDFDLVSTCTKYICELTSKYGSKSTRKEPSPYIEIFKKILIELNNDYVNIKSGEKKMPKLNILFTFKLISTLFPTSDFRHQITTPCLLIMNRYLFQCQIQNVGDCFRGLFLSNLCYDFISKSKRFIPECVQFLNGVLYLAVDWKTAKQKLTDYEQSTIYESFKRTKLNLIVSSKIDKLNELCISQMSQIELENINDSTKGSIVAYAIDLFNVFCESYEENICFREIFSLTKKLIKNLPIQNYSNDLKKRIESIESLIEKNSCKPREHLKCLSKKPIPNKLLEPKIQTKSKFDPRHHNSVISEKQLLTRKLKKEHKAAIKEIRQDSQFIARVQLKEQMDKDASRSKKVKEIMSSLSNQEGEYQKLKRMKS